MLAKKPKILLHICCAGCGAYVSQMLKENYFVTLFFNNPNIYPKHEYDLRFKEVTEISLKYGLPLITGEYAHNSWLEKINGFESEPEKGERCQICYRDRLQKTAETAKKNNFEYFTTTLTVSPHKLAQLIIKIGQDLAENFGVKFLDIDFKKKDGFKKAGILSRELNLYRQDFCGCEFSRKK
jgi:predicted adenine nucleotide alpha hydrolase (AANH) superfamily ATPase